MPLNAAIGSRVSAASQSPCRRSGCEGAIRRKCKYKYEKLNAKAQWNKDAKKENFNTKTPRLKEHRDKNIIAQKFAERVTKM